MSREVDWSLVVTHLRGAGMSASGIARKCGMERQTVTRLQEGVQGDPRWRQGMALLDLHVAVCPEKPVPTVGLQS